MGGETDGRWSWWEVRLVEDGAGGEVRLMEDGAGGR